MNSNIVKTLNYIKRNGIKKGYYAVRERLELRKQPPYVYTPISEEERLGQIAEVMEVKTKFSLLVPAFETNPTYMTALIDSVRAQTYSRWELIIADASVTDIVKSVIDQYADPRIRHIRLKSNMGISNNTNAGLSFCTGEYIGLLDHDDILTSDALYRMVKKIEESKSKGKALEMLYSDEDKTNGENTAFFDPNIKPKFNLDLILSNNYICHFLVLKADLLKSLGFRSEYDGAQDHDLILRAVSLMQASLGDEYEEYIYHEPRVLYHWRCHENSTAANPKSKEYAYVAGKRAVQDYINREGMKAVVEDRPHMGFFYVKYMPNIFNNRRNVAAVTGRVLDKKGRVTDGAYDEALNLMFKGQNRYYSGAPLHRMACQMEVPYINPKYMIASKKVKKEYSSFIKEGGFDKENPPIKEFCDMMRAKGYIFVYDPKLLYRENGERI